MKSSIISTTFLLALISSAFSATAAEQCFRIAGGDTDVKVGWFSGKTYRVDSFCIQGDYTKMGISEPLGFVFKMGDTALANYRARSERYSDKQIRFTLADGESEPTQFDAEMSVRQNRLTNISFAGYVTPLKSGGRYVCLENEKPYYRAWRTRAELNQVGATTAWNLELFNDDTKVDQFYLKASLRVTEEEDVNFVVSNPDIETSFQMYLDEEESNYLSLPGLDKDILFTCGAE